MQSFEDKMRRGGAEAVAEAERFFMRTDPVHRTLREICARLDQLGIEYAVAGGMALVPHGYDRTTSDVDILVSAAGLEATHRALGGLGYVPVFQNSRSLRDTQTGVRIEFQVEGQYPGDRKPKPVAFPAPAAAGERIGGICYVRLPTLIELKLASGMTNPGRLKDLADVQELIRVLNLPRSLRDQLNPFVRAKFDELWASAQPDPEA